MTILEPADIQRKIVGSWQLPIHDDYSETITLHGAPRRLVYTCSAASFKERLRQFFVGDELYGNWQIRTSRSKQSKSAIASSVGGSLKRSTTGSLTWISPRFEKEGSPSNTNDEYETGLFLVLNFTDIPKSLLNLNLVGLRIDIGNWLNNLREMIEDDSFKIISLTDKDTKLTLQGKKGIQVWTKIQHGMGME